MIYINANYSEDFESICWYYKESSNKTSRCRAVCVYVDLRNEAWPGT